LVKSEKIQALSVHLGKPTIKDESHFVEAKDTWSYKIALGTLDANLVVKQVAPTRPKWASFLQDGCANTIKASASTASGLLTFQTGGRWFALSFGHGRHMLAPGSCEEDFGLRVCLNGADKLRSVDRRTFEAGVRQGREQTGRDSDMSAFGLNIEHDMLRAVTGTPNRKLKLGTRISGMDSLSITIPVTLKRLPALARQLLGLFKQTDYKRAYPWIDHIREVRDTTITDQLDERLAELVARQSDQVWMAVPEVVDWQSIEFFGHSIAKGSRRFPDLHINELRTHVLATDTINVSSIRRARVFQFGPNEQLTGRRWTAFDCLYCELPLHGALYILSGGKWYRVDKTYAEEVTKTVGSLKPTSITLPKARIGEDEGAYNARAATAMSNVQLLDKKLVKLKTHVGQIEICDLLHNTQRIFVHVKRWGASSVLSHLFAQGFVSGDLFLHSEEFRVEARKRIGGTWVPSTPIAKDYEIAFALISQSRRPLSLPVFSQVNLSACVAKLKGRGYRVTLTKIQAE